MRSGHSSAGRHRAAMLAAVSAGLVAAACGSAGTTGNAQSGAPAPAASPSASPATTTESRPTAPLTGLPTSARDATRPAVAIVISGPDLLGLSSADLVFEDFATPQRYIAVFQSKPASFVGPVTSTRPEDGQILSVVRALTGYDGGTTSFIQVLDKTKVPDLGYPAHASLYHLGTDGLTASTNKFDTAERGAAPPPELFSYRAFGPGSGKLAAAGERRPTSVTITIPRYGTQKWVFDAHADLWAESSGGPSVQVANLIIQTVPYKVVFTNRRFGQTVPSARVIGRGAAEVFSGTAGTTDQGQGGLSATGTWVKRGLHDVTEFVDSTGFPMNLQPGPTWIILAPDDTQVRTVQAPS